MILPDVNVLVYAFRADAAEHAVSKRWLDGVIAADAQFGIAPLALSEVVRITTHTRIFKEPSSIDEALAYCNNLLGQPHCDVVQPGDRHWTIFCSLCRSAGVRGPLVADAWFAALAIEHGCTWITYDRDYARFPGLDWREPTG